MSDFTLKQKDAYAPITICFWIMEALKDHKGMDNIVVNKAKLAKAARHLADILDYQYQNGCQVPD